MQKVMRGFDSVREHNVLQQRMVQPLQHGVYQSQVAEEGDCVAICYSPTFNRRPENFKIYYWSVSLVRTEPLVPFVICVS